MAETKLVKKDGSGRELKDISFGKNIFSGSDAFLLALKMAKYLALSTIIPKHYQGNESNCLIAIEMSNRLGTSFMQVMQNLYIVNGTPAWSAQYVIAMINSSKKYKTELQYDLTGKDEAMACYAFAEDYAGHRVKGPTITMAMAIAEGWVGRNGSKWKTMPEVMIRYRAAAFFGRLNCPDMIMGIYTKDEVIEDMAYAFVNPAETVAIEMKEKANTTAIDFDATEGIKTPLITDEEQRDTVEMEETPIDDDELPEFLR